MCTKEVHELLIQEDNIVNCIFCSKKSQDPVRPERYFCCDSMKLIKDGYLVCKNCAQVHDEYFASEYVDFYENRHRIRKKSVYHRKYHIINVMNDIAQKNNIQIGVKPPAIAPIAIKPVEDIFTARFSFLKYLHSF